MDCAQAFGAKNYKMLGTVLQRAVLIGWVACVPVSVLWLNMEPLLLRLGQDPEIVSGACRWVQPRAQPEGRFLGG